MVLTAEIVKNNFNGTNARFIRCDKTFLFMSSVKKTLKYWEHLSYDVEPMVEQLGIPIYFLCQTGGKNVHVLNNL